MEARKLPEFKTMVIRKFKELRTSTALKKGMETLKNQSEMKDTLTEMKNEL